MTGHEVSPTKLKAGAVIAFPRVEEFLDSIVSSLASHDMVVTSAEHGFNVGTPFGSAHIDPGNGKLRLAVETCEPAALNRLKQALTGLITFVARTENLQVVWEGDRTGPTPPPDLRVLTVEQTRQITRRVKRLALTGSDLQRYDVPNQIHCRLLFQAPGTVDPQWPMLDDDGQIMWPGGDNRLDSRVYTIRRIDHQAGVIEIDFVLHDSAGPATRWARTASAGDIVGLLGPAAYGSRPAVYYVLAGDETGLPGIARILGSLPAAARGIAFVEVADSSEQQDIPHPDGFHIRWLDRNGAEPGTTSHLRDAIRRFDWPEKLTDVFFWGGYEFETFRDIRRYLKSDLRLPQSCQVSFPHWRRGMSEDDIVAIGGTAISD